MTVQVFDVYLYAPDPADTIVGVDVSIVNGATAYGPSCTSGIYQAWWEPFAGFTFQTPDMGSAWKLDASDLAADSHFMLVGDDPQVSGEMHDWSEGEATASEQNDQSLGSDGSTGSHGYGSMKTPAGFITESARAQDLYFAHVTVQYDPGNCAYAEFSNLEGGGVANSTGSVFDLEGVPIGPIPEPATMALMVLGGLAVVARKRRR
jgi:hypothetical protein